MTPDLPLVQIEGGMSIDAALSVFRAGCNHGPERLFITESWIGPRFDNLRGLLTDPITIEEAEALKDVVLKRRNLDEVIEWLEHRPATWEEYVELSRRRATKGWKGLRERGYFPWEDVEACRASEPPAFGGPIVLVLHDSPRGVDEAKRLYASSAVPCSTCGAAPEELTWIYFRSPAWTWELMCGRAGWLTVCDGCHLQVDFFMEAMN